MKAQARRIKAARLTINHKAMFKKEEGIEEIETIIGPSVQVEGDFVTAGDIVIEGTVSGKLKTEKNLRVGTGARIIANVTAKNAIIAGEVQGNVKVDGNLELSSTARIFGDIKAATLTIASGACLHGKCQAGEDKKSKVEKIEDRVKLKLREKERTAQSPAIIA